MSARVIIGDLSSPMATYNADAIQKCSCVMSSALSGEELVIDQLLPVIYSAAYVRVRFVPSGSTGLTTADGYTFTVYPTDLCPDTIPYGTPVYFYQDDTLIGKFYFKQAVRTAKTYFDLTAVSGIGIIDGQKHYGGIYTGQTFEAVAREIINGVFSFTCADDVRNVPIYGWLPIASRRENLHQLLFATGVILLKDETGEVYFRYPNTETRKNVPDNRIFYGGNVDYLTPATRADVTEHTFISLDSDEQVTLFDNTSSGELATDVFVSFQDAPIHDLQTTGSLSVSESGVNYAVVSGVGTLTGKKYTHVTRVLTKSTQSRRASGGEQKTASVTSATLVSVANSLNVLDRVSSYYASARRIRSDIVLTDEKPGDLISMNNPYDEAENAFMAEMDISSGSFLRAACELITGYVPSGGGNNYTQSVLLTGTGEFVVPDGVYKIRAALIPGGTGGSGGYRGGSADTIEGRYDGDDNYITWTQRKPDGTEVNLGGISEDDPSIVDGKLPIPGGKEPGKGGAPGIQGYGGKVLVVTLDVTPGQRIAYSCGVGGAGGKGQPADGSTEPTAGEEGTPTTFGGYTSANGSYIPEGYLDVFSGVLYAGSGDTGLPGGDGYLGGEGYFDNGQGPNPGLAGSGYIIDEDGRKRAYDGAGGGSGGSAYGAKNPKGQDSGGDVTVKDDSDCPVGNGVDGADALPFSAPTIIGKGGGAGNGGGGGSCAGALRREKGYRWISVGMYRDGGKGGAGSDGTLGAPGGVLIFM